jgi:hypothetical protein
MPETEEALAMWNQVKTKIKGWKTIAWNSLIGVSGVVLYLIDQLQTVDFSKALTPSTVGWLMIGLAIVGILLRAVTTNAIGAK